MKVLVSGGAGYIGSVLVRKLIEYGHEVIILDRLFFGEESVKGYKCMLIREDIRNFRDEWLDDVDAVAHLAGLSNDPTAEYRPEANHQMNVVATENLVKACIRREIKNFTFASSASIYDNQAEYNGMFPPLRTENCSVFPSGSYSSSKHDAEKIIMSTFGPHFQAAILRQGTVYGHSPRPRFDLVVNAFVKDALTKGKITLHDGGDMWRPLVHVNDVAEAHIRALNMGTCGIVNLVGENLQIRDVAGMVAGAFDLFFARHTDKKVVIEQSSYSPAIKRNYRISDYISKVMGFNTPMTVFKGAYDMFERYSSWTPEQLLAPQHYNVRHMELLEDVHNGQSAFRGIYDLKEIA